MIAEPPRCKETGVAANTVTLREVDPITKLPLRGWSCPDHNVVGGFEHFAWDTSGRSYARFPWWKT